jgi:serine/threonine protein kinase
MGSFDCKNDSSPTYEGHFSFLDNAHHYAEMTDPEVVRHARSTHPTLEADQLLHVLRGRIGLNNREVAFPIHLQREAVGRGNYGSVSHYTELLSGTDLAIKFIYAFKSYVELTDAEMGICRDTRIGIANCLLDEHIAVYRGQGFVGDQRVECSDYVQGDNLKNVLKQSHLSLEDRISLALNLIQGVQAFHDRNLIHRDMKPENVIITPAQPSGGLPQAVIIDLGTLIDASHYRWKLLSQTKPLGTLPQIPPEAFTYEQPESEEELQRMAFSFDAYGLGFTLTSLFGGKLGIPQPSGRRIDLGNPSIHSENFLVPALNHALENDQEISVDLPAETPASLQSMIQGLVRLRWRERLSLNEAREMLEKMT